jgi:hypothetical protein
VYPLTPTVASTSDTDPIVSRRLRTSTRTGMYPIHARPDVDESAVMHGADGLSRRETSTSVVRPAQAPPHRSSSLSLHAHHQSRYLLRHTRRVEPSVNIFNSRRTRRHHRRARARPPLTPRLVLQRQGYNSRRARRVSTHVPRADTLHRRSPVPTRTRTRSHPPRSASAPTTQPAPAPAPEGTVVVRFTQRPRKGRIGRALMGA